MANDEDDFKDKGGPEVRPPDRGSVEARPARATPARTEPVRAAPAAAAPPPRRNDPVPDLALVHLPPDALRPAQRRVRRTQKAQVARIRRSIERFGAVKPILIAGDNEIIDGHDVLEALRQTGAERVPCLRVDHLGDLEIRQLRIALNKIAETGSWDFDALKLEFEELLDFDVDLEITGFEIGEIDQVLAFGDGVEADPLDAMEAWPDEDAPVISRPGDLWCLGEHRLLCGDARNPADLRSLIGDEPAAMLLTDPPYNVRINGHVRSGRTRRYREFAEASGEMSQEAFTAFLTEALGLAAEVLTPDAPAFVFMDWRHMRELDLALAAAGFRIINLCVWVKSVGGMGGLYRSRHELVFVAARGPANPRNNVQLGRFGRNRSNVWEYAGATGGASDPEDDFAAHPTVKPIRLLADAILDVTAAGDIVLDTFAGSGSTLLAAERTRRRCRALEIDPAYVDLTIRRWQAMSGQDAILDETGETFGAAARRGNDEPDPSPAHGSSEEGERQEATREEQS
jgi:DNA modification methylase